MAPGHADVRVTRGADGTIRIAAGPDLRRAGAYGDVVAVGPDLTRAVLDVAGAVLTWPVLGEPGLPWAEVHDAGRTQQWVWALYGERVAAAVHDIAAGQADVRVAAEATALAGAAARLGLGHWAARWWPASHPDGIPALEPDLLGLESAALTHRCQQLFDDEDDQPDDCAAELIEEHRAALAPLIEWWRATPVPTDLARQLESVLRLVDDAADSAGLGGPALRHLRSSLDGTGPVAASTGPGTLFARHGGYALAAGEPLVAGGRVIARGTGTNDWRRYPPGLRRRRRERGVLDRSRARRTAADRGRGPRRPRRTRHRHAARRGGPRERRRPAPSASRQARRPVDRPLGPVPGSVGRGVGPAYRGRRPAARLRPGPRRTG